MSISKLLRAARHCALALFVLPAFFTTSAIAAAGTDPGLCETLRTANPTDHWIWITVYDVAKLRHLDYGWVGPHSTRAWRSGGYICGSYYYVRAEVKQATWRDGPNAPQNSPNIFDTRVQFNPHALTYSSWVVTLQESGKSYWWEHGNPYGCIPGRPCDKPPEPYVPKK